VKHGWMTIARIWNLELHNDYPISYEKSLTMLARFWRIRDPKNESYERMRRMMKVELPPGRNVLADATAGENERLYNHIVHESIFHWDPKIDRHKTELGYYSRVSL
jgi:hypothetical protein